MREIEIDDEVWEILYAEHRPMIDTANTVLRRLLGLPKEARSAAEPQAYPRQQRVAPGSLLPEREYWLPILEVLDDAGGAAPSRQVVTAVGERLAPRLSPLDHGRLEDGGIRWQNRVHFARLRMVEQGLLRRDSPRGIWEIARPGRDWLEKVRSQEKSAR